MKQQATGFQDILLGGNSAFKYFETLMIIASDYMATQWLRQLQNQWDEKQLQEAKWLHLKSSHFEKCTIGERFQNALTLIHLENATVSSLCSGDRFMIQIQGKLFGDPRVLPVYFQLETHISDLGISEPSLVGISYFIQPLQES